MTILKTIQLLSLLAVLTVGPFSTPKATAQPGVSVPLQAFYDELAPYGQWTQNPNYGSVWIPNAGPDFQPYATNGHWIVTEFGNTWVSDYPWGWAPFHYGRWYYDNYYGWAWVPGPDWGPAWVSWRSGGGYYGWAPLGPGIGINVNINIPAPYWTFVPQLYITSPRLYSYCVPRPNVVNIYQNTTIINNIYRSNNQAYVYGPPRGDIERITRQPVPVYRIDNLDRPGRAVMGNGSVGFYRPDRSAGGPDYSRSGGYNNQFDNRPRPDYNGNNVPNQGNYGNNRPDWNASRGNVPNRDYNANAAPNRGNYGGNFPPDQRGNGGYTARPDANTGYNQQPDRSGRFDPNGGNFPGNRPVESGNTAPQGGFPQRQNRPFEQPSAQPPVANQPMPGNRGDGGYRPMPENRSGQFQPRVQEPGQPQRAGGSESFPGGGRRGPR